VQESHSRRRRERGEGAKWAFRNARHSSGTDIARIRIGKGIGEAKRPEGYLPYPMIVYSDVGGSQFVSCELPAGLSSKAWEINAGRTNRVWLSHERAFGGTRGGTFRPVMAYKSFKTSNSEAVRTSARARQKGPPLPLSP